MRVIFKIILFCFLSSIVLGQNEIVRIKVNLKDQKTNDTIEQTQLVITNVQQGSNLRVNIHTGDTLNLPANGEAVWKIIARSHGYKKLDTIIYLNEYRRLIRKQKVLSIDLLFSFDGQYTGEVDISGIYKPEVKFGSDTLSVSDYVLIDDRHQVLLTYPKRLDKGSELIWLEDEEIEGRREIQGVAKSLITDFQGTIYLRCENDDFKVDPDKLLNLTVVNTRELENYVLPIIDSLELSRVYFSNYNPYYPAYDYFMVEKTDTSYTKLRHIEDDLMMEQYRAEYKWADVRTKLWAWDMEAETGIDREIWVGANIFTNSIYYDPPIGDLYRDGQDLFVYDFYKSHIIKYDAYDGAAVDSCEISFHLKPRKTGWEQKIVQDPVTKKLYTYFDQAGYMEIAEVDPNNGELESGYELHYRYVENIQIYNGMVYYIYRPYESPQKKFLYFEDLNRHKDEVSTGR
jgi:hypothetical protein